jgi:hypothetical protein
MTVCGQLREAILASGRTFYRIGKDSGVKPEVVGRFAKGQRDVRGETLDRIAAALGLELTAKKEG